MPPGLPTGSALWGQESHAGRLSAARPLVPALLGIKRVASQSGWSRFFQGFGIAYTLADIRRIQRKKIAHGFCDADGGGGTAGGWMKYVAAMELGMSFRGGF